MCNLSNYLWVAPLAVVAAMLILWFEFGPSGLVGIGIMIICVPLQAWLGKFFAYMR